MDDTLKKDQLYQKLKKDIADGVTPSGFRFPPEVEWAAQLGVSRNTLRSALRQLEDEQLVERHKSKGTFVAEPPPVLRYMWLSDPGRQDEPSEYIQAQFQQGIESRLRRSGFEIEFCFISNLEALGEGGTAVLIRERNIRGVICRTGNFNGNEPFFLYLKKLGIPVVLLYCWPKDYLVTGWPVIAQNTRHIWSEALAYLRSLGHTRVATLSLSSTDIIRGEFKAPEYAELLNTIGLDPDPELVISACDDREAVYQAVLQRLREIKAPTAILCYSDFLAPSVYRALAELGLRIPEDVSVMGYSGSPFSEYLNPPLSTIAIDYRRMGQLAVEILERSEEWQGSGKRRPPRLMAPYLLQERKSTRRIGN